MLYNQILFCFKHGVIEECYGMDAHHVFKGQREVYKTVINIVSLLLKCMLTGKPNSPDARNSACLSFPNLSDSRPQLFQRYLTVSSGHHEVPALLFVLGLPLLIDGALSECH